MSVSRDIFFDSPGSIGQVVRAVNRALAPEQPLRVDTVASEQGSWQVAEGGVGGPNASGPILLSPWPRAPGGSPPRLTAWRSAPTIPGEGPRSQGASVRDRRRLRLSHRKGLRVGRQPRTAAREPLRLGHQVGPRSLLVEGPMY